MKILHLSDLHIGRGINQVSLIDDQKYVLDQIVNLVKEENIKYVLIAGDLFDKPIPSIEATKVLNDFFYKLIDEVHASVYCINGNHDSSDRLNFASILLKRTGLFIDTIIGDDFKIPHYVLNEGDVKVNLYSLPFFSPTFVRVRMQKEYIKTYQEAVHELLKVNPINKDEINIIQTHFLVLNAEEEVKTSSSEMPISVGGIDKISYHEFDDFDYVALGHLHHPQHIGRENVRYGGSILKYSDNEVHQKKCFTILDIKSKDDITIIKKEIKPLRDFVEVSDTFENIIHNVNHLDPNNLYSIILFDDNVIINAASRIRCVLPNLIKLDYQKHIESESKRKVDSSFKGKTLQEQFASFFEITTGEEMSEEEKEYFNKLTKGEDE